MPIRRIKDFSGLVSRSILRSSRRPHYWHVFLWRDKEALIAGTKDMEDGKAIGCHCPSSTIMDVESGELYPSPKRGEVHFIVGRWNEEIVAHELQHAILHRLRTMLPSYKEILGQDDINAEEEICYEFGRWFASTWKWLWENDPSSKWKRVES